MILGDFNFLRFTHEKMFSDHDIVSAMDELTCCLDGIGLSFLYFKHLQRFKLKKNRTIKKVRVCGLHLTKDFYIVGYFWVQSDN